MQMKMELKRIASDIQSGHTSETKNHILYFNQVTEQQGMVMVVQGNLTFPMTKEQADKYVIDGIYDVTVGAGE